MPQQKVLMRSSPLVRISRSGLRLSGGVKALGDGLFVDGGRILPPVLPLLPECVKGVHQFGAPTVVERHIEAQATVAGGLSLAL